MTVLSENLICMKRIRACMGEKIQKKSERNTLFRTDKWLIVHCKNRKTYVFLPKDFFLFLTHPKI